MSRTVKQFRQAALALGVTVLVAGCAGPNPRDPYEGYNRAMYNFNDTVDTYALKPVATGPAMADVAIRKLAAAARTRRMNFSSQA